MNALLSTPVSAQVVAKLVSENPAGGHVRSEGQGLSGWRSTSPDHRAVIQTFSA